MKTIVALVGLLVLSQVAAPRPVPDLEAAVRAYAAGDHAGAIATVTSGRVTIGVLTSALDRWIAGGADAERTRRALIASTFALDAVWTTTRSSGWMNYDPVNLDPWGRVTPSEPDRVALSSFVAEGYAGAWVMRQASQAVPSEERRRLDLAVIGVMEDGHAWHLLQEALPALRASLPGEARVRLAEVLAVTNRDLGTLRLSAATRIDVMRDENLGSSVTNRIPRAQRQFDALGSDPVVGGEALLHSAFLELRLRHWKAGRERLILARPRQTEPILRAAVDYLTGWTSERLGDTDAAIAAYRRALEVTPTMRNLATELSALLFLRNERNEAYAILDRAFNADDPPDDFVMIIERADARFVDGHLRALREALR